MDSIRGVEIHYYAICRRKLWLFNKGIRFEEDGNERVQAGKILHEKAYPRLEKELSIDENIRVDRQDGEILREIKLTSKMQEADILQMKYYLYVYKQKGLVKKGLLSYPKEKKVIEVMLEDDDEKRIVETLNNINKIVKGPIPVYRKLPYCSSCAYRDFCYSGEIDEDGS